MISKDSKDDANELIYKILKIFDEYYENCGEEQERLSKESSDITISVLCILLSSYCVETDISINELKNLIKRTYNMSKKIKDNDKFP